MYVKKRTGEEVNFDNNRIVQAVLKAGTAAQEIELHQAQYVASVVLQKLVSRYESPFAVEHIQDIVEATLLNLGYVETARAYIRYREQHRKLREDKITTMDVTQSINEYLDRSDWRVQANANQGYSLGGMILNTSGKATANYWLNHIYAPEFGKAHKDGSLHCHDLDLLCAYTYFGKETIIVKLNDKMLNTSFEQVYALLSEEEVLLNADDNAYAKYPKNLQVLDKNGWVVVTRMVRKQKSRPMHVVKSHGGRSIIVTDNHPIISNRGEIPAKDVQKNLDSMFEVNLQKLLPEANLFTETRIDLLKELLSQKVFRFDSAKHTIYFNNTPIEDLIGLPEEDGYLHIQSQIIPRFINLSETFGYVIGFLIAEGMLSYTDGTNKTISIYNTDTKILKSLGATLLSELHIPSAIDEGRSLVISNYFFKYLIKHVFGLQESSRNINIPIRYLNYCKEFNLGIVGGIIDGDGAVKDRQVSIRVTSRTMLEQLATLLSYFGFCVRDRSLNGVGTTRTYNGREIVQRYPLYGISFRKTSVMIPSHKYASIAISEKTSHPEKRGMWYPIVVNDETPIADTDIYDITTTSGTFIANGLLVHNCAGWSLRQLLMEGYNGVPGKVASKPPKHLASAIAQMVNFLGTLQNEWAGAQAFSSFDTYLAPFIRADNLSYEEVKQCVQEFVFSMNAPSRWGSQCVDEETDCLSVYGWKKHNELTEGDLIYTFNMNTHAIELKPLQRVTAYNYDGNLIELKNRKTCQWLTPHHKVVRKVFNSDKYEFVKAAELGKFKTPINVPLALPVSNRSGVTLSDAQIKLMAWLLSDAYLEEKPRVRIYQSKPQYITEIRQLLTSLNIPFTEHVKDGNNIFDKNTILKSDRKPCTYFSIYGEEANTLITLVNNDRNHIPRWFLQEATAHQLSVFIEEYRKADGNSTRKAKKLYKKYETMINDLQEALTLAGLASSVTRRDEVTPCINIHERNVASITSVREVPYKGKVWCPTTENGTFIARKNGNVFITGNTVFSNITMDLTCPPDLRDQNPYIGGEPYETMRYGELQTEMDMINKAFIEVMVEGDAEGRPFTFPIPTYNITKDFDWEHPNTQLMFEMTAKYGIPYFQNFLNSDLDPHMIRSMCCRLSLNLDVLINRGNGLFGSAEMTGSLGVVTINTARLGHLFKGNKNTLYAELDRLMDLAKDSLVTKRKILTRLLNAGLYPYTKRYLHVGYRNHFNTIGLNGLNECIINYTDGKEDIGTEYGVLFAEEFLLHMREKLQQFQEETGEMFNLEASPAESASYRFAREDKKRFPDIITAGTEDNPYYTNSSQLPVNYTDDVFEALTKQEPLQKLYSGGCIEGGNLVVTNKGTFPIEYIVDNFNQLSPIRALSYNTNKGCSEWDTITDVHTIDMQQSNKIRVVMEKNIDITTSDWHPFLVLEKPSQKITCCPVCNKEVKSVKALASHLRHNPECHKNYVPKKQQTYTVYEKRADELQIGDYVLQNSTNMMNDNEAYLSADEFYLLGFFIGNGSMTMWIDDRGGNSIPKPIVDFHSGSAEVMDRVVSILNTRFGCEVQAIQKDKRGDGLTIRTTKQTVVNFFNRYGFTCGPKAYNVCIPDEVKQSITCNSFYALLSGLIDSDGSINKDGTISYYTVSPQLAQDIVNLGTLSGLMISYNKKTKVRDNEQPLYVITIPAEQSTRLFENLSIVKNTDLVNKQISNKVRRHLPVSRVKAVTKEGIGTVPFYDLTTESNHNYLAGKNSFVFIHNTVFHLYTDEAITAESAKIIVKKILTNFRIPYLTLSPIYSVCPKHGYIPGNHEYCPKCDKELVAQKLQSLAESGGILS